MLNSPPPFEYRPRRESAEYQYAMPSLGRRMQRPHTATGMGSAFATGTADGQRTSTSTSTSTSASPRASGSRRATTALQPSSGAAHPQPATASSLPGPPRWPPATMADCFVTRNGRKLHAFPAAKAPYPLCFDREFLDLDVMDHLELVKLKGGTGSMVDFTNGTPRKALDLGCGVSPWIMEAARLWPVGFDLVPVQINLSLAHSSIASRVEWVHGNFLTHKLPFADGEFDHVHIRYVSKGVPEDKWDVLFEEVWRVLSPGGSFNLIEEDVMFPTLPRSFTAKPRHRRKAHKINGEPIPMPEHDHALLEHLFFSVFERRFINTKPTSILHGLMNIHFRHVYCGPRIDLPYPPPPLPQDNGTGGAKQSSGSSAKSTSSSSSPGTGTEPLPQPGTSKEPPRPDTAASDAPTLKSGKTPPQAYKPFEAAEEHRLQLTSEERKQLQHAPAPLHSFAKWTPRGLALHLYHAYMSVLAMREAMWDELVLQLKEERRRPELIAAGWDEDEDEPRVRFEQLVASYAADMHARTSFKDALWESLGWVAPKKAPLTKAELAFELDRERERTAARKLEEKMGFCEDTMVSRSVRGWCGFKEGKPAASPVPAPAAAAVAAAP
ncbi:hypothetical protein AURDEDRAFT_134839 [Auricularia subglabra TFB-10046 SS5]|nr:hypothetical protein AURDEDRAFT_134839 [Auricularia subglabra TFB-10046 SS5]